MTLRLTFTTYLTYIIPLEILLEISDEPFVPNITSNVKTLDNILSEKIY